MSLNRPRFTAMQRQLLTLLRENSGRAISRDEILDALWGAEYFPDSNIVDRHVSNLRARLGDGWGRHLERHIGTVVGTGYIWMAPD